MVNTGHLIGNPDQEASVTVLAMLRTIKIVARRRRNGSNRRYHREHPGMVYVKIPVMGGKILPLLLDEQLPRIS